MIEHENADEIRKNILCFFKQNYMRCLDALMDAEDKKIGEIYQLKTDFVNYAKKSDVLILTANKFETNMLHQSINKTTKQQIIQCDYKFNNVSYEVYFFQWGQYYCTHIMAPSTGSNTINGSEDMVRMMFKIKNFNPLAVVSFGICFGIDYKKQRLCDVIISNKVYSYGVGIKIKNGRIEISDDNNFAVDSNIYNKIDKMLQKNQLNKDSDFLKNYITGEAVVSNEEFKQTIIKEVATNGDIFAGEMEGYGIFKECKKYGKFGDGTRPIPCIIIKSICDWGAEKNGFFSNDNTKLILEQLTEEHRAIIDMIHSYYLGEGIAPPENIENTIKDSIQAYASKRAFNTCNIIFSSSSMAFGINPYYFIYNRIKDLRDRHDRAIEDKYLIECLKQEYGYLSDEDINDIIHDLIKEKVINDKDELGFYTYVK